MGSLLVVYGSGLGLDDGQNIHDLFATTDCADYADWLSLFAAFAFFFGWLMVKASGFEVFGLASLFVTFAFLPYLGGGQNIRDWFGTTDCADYADLLALFLAYSSTLGLGRGQNMRLLGFWMASLFGTVGLCLGWGVG